MRRRHIHTHNSGGGDTLRQLPSTQEYGASTRCYHREPLRQLQSGECSTTCRKTPRRRSRAEEKQVLGLVPRYLHPPSSRRVNVWRGWPRRAYPHQRARHQTGRAQVGDTLQRVPASSGEDGSSTSSAAILFCFIAGFFISHASSSASSADRG